VTCSSTPRRGRSATCRVDTTPYARSRRTRRARSFRGARSRTLVDFERILGSGLSLESILDDAQRKDASADPASIAWVLDQITIGPRAALPGGVDPVRLSAFRDDLVNRLRALAMRHVRRS